MLILPDITLGAGFPATESGEMVSEVQGRVKSLQEQLAAAIAEVTV